MARLVVDENGRASGHLAGNLAFMRLRAQQDTVCPLDAGETGDTQHTATSPVTDTEQWTWLDNPDQRVPYD